MHMTCLISNSCSLCVVLDYALSAYQALMVLLLSHRLVVSDPVRLCWDRAFAAPSDVRVYFCTDVFLWIA